MDPINYIKMEEAVKIEPETLLEENLLNCSSSQQRMDASMKMVLRHRPKKRKLDNTNRKFKSCWSEKYFFFPVGDKPVCLICKETRSVNKEFNLRRHYLTKHSDYTIYSGSARKEKFDELQRSFAKAMYFKQNAESANIIRASLAISEILAKTNHSYTEGEFIKECLISITVCLFPEKKDLISNIDLTPNHICDCIKELSENLKSTLREHAAQFEFYSFAVFLDELCDYEDITQLAVCVRGIDKDFLISEELAGFICLREKWSNATISQALLHITEDIGLNLHNLCGIMTDGSPILVKKANGVISLIENERKCLGTPTPEVFKMHCIIHQNVIWSKSHKINNVLHVVKKILNFTYCHFFDHENFQVLIDRMLSEIEDIYLCEVDGSMLHFIYKFRNELFKFIQSKGEIVPELNDPCWLSELAFLVDITNHILDFSSKIVIKGLLINEICNHLRAFEMKLKLWESQIQSSNFAHFPTLSESLLDYSDDINGFVTEIQYLQKEFSSRFADLHASNFDFLLFSSPFHVDVNDSPISFQMELVELHCNSDLKSKFQDVPLLTFYKNYLPHRQFPSLTSHAKKMASLFGSTYLCDHLYSQMRVAKSKKRTLFNDKSLDGCLRIGASSFETNFDNIVKKLMDSSSLDDYPDS